MNFKFYKNLSFFRKATIAFFLVFSINIVQAQTGNPIPGYDYLGACNGHHYYLSVNSFDGPQLAAAVATAPAGGYLATLNSAAENECVYNFLLTENIRRYGGDGKSGVNIFQDPRNPWIGLKDALDEGRFQWANGEPVCFTNWNPPVEPNNLNDEDYTQILSWNGKWNDLENGYPRAYILEYGPKKVICSFTITTSPITCFGVNNGSVTFSLTGGSGPYTYTISGGITGTLTLSSGSNPLAYSATVSNLAPGSYSYSINNPAGTVVPGSNFIIGGSDLTQLAASVTPTNPTCPAGNNGSITITPSGGTAPYSIAVNGSTSSPLPSAGTTFNNLNAGTYNYAITDANGCTITKTVNLLACPPVIDCKVANGDFTNTTIQSDLHRGLPRNGSVQVVNNVNQLGGGGYLNISSAGGNFLAAHTSNNASDRIVFTKVTGLTSGQKYNFCVDATLLKNLGSGAKFIIAVYAGSKKIGEGRVTFDWTTICGEFTAPANGEIELSVRDDKKGLFFVALDNLCVTEVSTTQRTAPPAPVVVVPPTTTPTSTVTEVTTAAAPKEKPVEVVLPETLVVSVMPNPSKSHFTIQLQAKNQVPVRVRVMDASGRMIKAINNLPSNHTFKVGSDFKKGTYFMEVIQESERRIVKLVKL